MIFDCSTAANQMFTLANGSRTGIPKNMIVITDGLSNTPTTTWTTAIQARSLGISTIAVGNYMMSSGQCARTYK